MKDTAEKNIAGARRHTCKKINRGCDVVVLPYSSCKSIYIEPLEVLYVRSNTGKTNELPCALCGPPPSFVDIVPTGCLIAELQISGVNAQLVQRPFDQSISFAVHGVHLVDAMQSYGPGYELLLTSSSTARERHLESDAPATSTGEGWYHIGGVRVVPLTGRGRGQMSVPRGKRGKVRTTWVGLYQFQILGGDCQYRITADLRLVKEPIRNARLNSFCFIPLSNCPFVLFLARCRLL